MSRFELTLFSLAFALLGSGPVSAKITQQELLDEQMAIVEFLQGSCPAIVQSRRQAIELGKSSLEVDVGADEACIVKPPTFERSALAMALSALTSATTSGIGGFVAGETIDAIVETLDKVDRSNCGGVGEMQEEFQVLIATAQGAVKAAEADSDKFRQTVLPQVDKRLSILDAVKSGDKSFESSRAAGKRAIGIHMAYCRTHLAQ